LQGQVSGDSITASGTAVANGGLCTLTVNFELTRS
jgi:hypothetical protein